MRAVQLLRHSVDRACGVLPLDAVARALSEADQAAEARVAPGDPSAAVSGEVLALAANLAGAGIATVGRLTRLARLPVGIPAVVTSAVNVPQVRSVIRAGLGADRAEPLLALGEAVTNTLAGQPTGMLVEAVHRMQRLSEARGRERVWARRAGELFAEDDRLADGAITDGEAIEPRETSAGTPGSAVPGAGAAGTGAGEPDPWVGPRPRPLPDGPVERYAARAALLGGAGLAAGLLTARPHLSVAALAAATARPARLAKETFAARLGRCVAENEMLVNDPRALRRLDRVDTVVLDAEVLTTGRWAINEIVPLVDGADASELYARVSGMVDADAPDTERRRGGWRLTPAEDGTAPSPAGRRAAGRRLLTLVRGDSPVARVTLLPELDPYTEALLAAATDVGRVLIAGRSSRLERRLKVSGVVAAGSKLAASVRALQDEGRGVVLIAAHGRSALAAADVGIAIAARGAGVRTRRAGAGHLICNAGLTDAVHLLCAVPAAKRAATAGVRIAGYAAGVAGVVGIASPPARASRNALLGSTIAAAAGLGAGLWHADPVVRMRAPRPADRNPWHAIPVGEVLRRLRSSRSGLTGAQAAERRTDGARQDVEAPSLPRAVAEELANPLTPALAAGAGLAAAVGSGVDAALIGGVVVVNALVGGVQRIGAGRAVRRLATRAAVPVRLLRDGRRITVGAEELVPGDVVELDAGDAVPADCRIVEAAGLEADEANLTGESLPVAKTAKPSAAPVPADRVSMLYDGTAVAAGRALATVVATGADTEAKRAEQLADPPRPAGVQGRLRELTRSTLPLSGGAGVLLLAANLLRGQPLRQAVGPAASLAVASVPEGLPSVATVAQLAAARRLSRRGVLVRDPATLESLGRLQALCFDKTGTLTEGRLRLRLVSDGSRAADPATLPDRLRAVLAAALRATPQPGGGERLAHPTDRAVVAGGHDAEVAADEGSPGWRRLAELPFEPARGVHATLGSRDGGERIVSVKGAPEVVIARCTARHAGTGHSPLDDRGRRRLTRAAGRLARRGYRVLAVAEGVASDDRLDEAELGGLCFLGFVALADRVRPAAAEAVVTLRGAGVRVVMVTGDHPDTAEAVAAELGVLDGGQVLSGAEIDRLDDDELIEILPKVTVFARTAPAQKVRVVRLLRRSGQVVAVTGDGANDAPAIRAAHVGIALGSRATPAARDAADVVVTDDRIETVVDAVVEGRVLWSSVRQALAVLLGGNLGEIGFAVGAGVVGGGGLNTRQLLVVNMLTDVVPALALAARPPAGATRRALLAEGPDASLGVALTRDIKVRAATTAGAAGAAWALARLTGTQVRASTVALVALVAAQLAQTVVAGRFDPVVVAACGASLAVLVAAVQVPGLSQALGSRPLGPVGWAIALSAAAAAAAVGHRLANRGVTAGEA